MLNFEHFEYVHLNCTPAPYLLRFLNTPLFVAAWQDFKKFGVFEAQEAMEKKHRLEEDELYEEMAEERRRQMQQLEKSLVAEREHTVRELVAWFENQRITQKERDAGLKKVHFQLVKPKFHYADFPGTSPDGEVSGKFA